MTRNTTLGVLLAVVVATSMLAAPVAASDSSISADPDEANAPSTHTVTANVGPSINGSSLTGLNVDYSATSQNGDVADVGESDIEEMYIERASGGTTDVSDDISGVGASNNGETLTIRLSGNYNVVEGDHVVVAYSGVTNPDTGEYEIVFTLNPQSGGTQSSDTLSISENGSADTPADGDDPTPTFESDDDDTPTDDEGTDDDTPTPTDEMDDGDDTPTPTDGETNGSDTATPTDGEGDGDAGGDEANDSEADDGAAGGGGSSGDGAGFGVAVAVAALLGAVLFARR
jgi:PGF-CTERM protein